jgi:hypothetical protein
MVKTARDLIAQSAYVKILTDAGLLMQYAQTAEVQTLESAIDDILKKLERLKDGEAAPATPPGPTNPASPSTAKSWTWEPSRIPWKDATGPKGPFEKADDPLNVEFRALLKDLKEHKGNLTRDGFYYWLFTDAEVVGRKRAK